MRPVSRLFVMRITILITSRGSQTGSAADVGSASTPLTRLARLVHTHTQTNSKQPEASGPRRRVADCRASLSSPSSHRSPMSLVARPPVAGSITDWDSRARILVFSLENEASSDGELAFAGRDRLKDSRRQQFGRRRCRSRQPPATGRQEESVPSPLSLERVYDEPDTARSLGSQPSGTRPRPVRTTQRLRNSTARTKSRRLRPSRSNSARSSKRPGKTMSTRPERKSPSRRATSQRCSTSSRPSCKNVRSRFLPTPSRQPQAVRACIRPRTWY